MKRRIDCIWSNEEQYLAAAGALLRGTPIPSHQEEGATWVFTAAAIDEIGDAACALHDESWKDILIAVVTRQVETALSHYKAVDWEHHLFIEEVDLDLQLEEDSEPTDLTLVVIAWSGHRLICTNEEFPADDPVLRREREVLRAQLGGDFN